MAIITLDEIEAEIKRREMRDTPPDPEKMKELTEWYSGVLAKFGLRRTEENAAAYDGLAAYCAKYRGGLDGYWMLPDHGVFLYGPTGTGKTTAMRIFSAIFLVDFIKINQIAINFVSDSAAGFWNWIDGFDKCPLIIDDIGNEEAVKSYGNKLPLPAIIDKRDEAMRRFGVATLFTGNMKSSKPLAEMYGDAFRSRILGMVGSENFLFMGGKDGRF